MWPPLVPSRSASADMVSSASPPSAIAAMASSSIRSWAIRPSRRRADPVAPPAGPAAPVAPAAPATPAAFPVFVARPYPGQGLDAVPIGGAS
ncbi:hypothetical protein GCM10017778_38040 [Streptomyces vinaceus]|nr:hypothetical protein GCM10017778_38040 [Streptomyces vinaceus]